MLREEMHSLGQEIMGSYEARVAAIAALHQEVGAQLKAAQAQLRQCDQVHQAMAHQQRDHLAKEQADLRGSVSAQLQELDRAHNAMAQQQRDHLAQSEAQRSSAVNAWLGQLATARAAGHTEWQRIEETLRARRAGGVAKAPAKAPGAPHRAEVSEEEAIARVQVGEVTLEFATLRDQVFQHLANHPDGTRLTELEQALGVSRFQMARVVRSLTDDGKAEKRGLSYFAI